MSEIQLPAYAKIVEGNPKLLVTVEVDSDIAYGLMLDELGVAADKVDQYWLEVAYQCIKLDVQAALEGTELCPVKNECAAQINFTRAPRWALINFPVGRGTLLATKGREARQHYKRLRGRIPFSG